MGTSTPIQLPSANLSKTPEECSAEILKTLFGYLPEEIRNDPETGTVITVPAAFNQMQKNATMQAAEMADLGEVALMQEPVAAVMSVTRTSNKDGVFLIYDLGGGTLDVAIAESIGGRINLLANGGIAMCGGRDFDRALMDNVVRPWLTETYNLPEDLTVNPDFKSLIRLSNWAAERAKVELSSKEVSVISLSETEVRTRDLDGNEIYLDIPLERSRMDKLIQAQLEESISYTREILNKNGLSPADLERIVFIGGPTNYKPLRDKVSFELGIQANTDANPMTAVAEGASLFAESIDWSKKNRSRKDSRGQVKSDSQLELSFRYLARTPSPKTKIAVNLGKPTDGAEFQIDSLDTGWTSGRLPLNHGNTVSITLPKNGENFFKIFVFDASGGPITLEDDKICITRTAATVDAIPASHSIGIEVLQKLGGQPVMEFLVRTGDSLPIKEKKTFKAAESLKAGSIGSINIKLWEGEIEEPITDNRPVGVLKINGTDFEDGVIPAGADLECEFEILDSGSITFEVSVPSIGSTFQSGKNFYSRQEGQLDFSGAAIFVAEQGHRTLDRVRDIQESVKDPKLDKAFDKLQAAVSLDPDEADTEMAQEAMEGVLEARRLLAQVRTEHLHDIRKIELNDLQNSFQNLLKEHATPSETSEYENLVKAAQRSLERSDRDFEHHVSEFKRLQFDILWSQEGFVVGIFHYFIKKPHLFIDQSRFNELRVSGLECLKNDDIVNLRQIVAHLQMIKIGGEDPATFDPANILAG